MRAPTSSEVLWQAARKASQVLSTGFVAYAAVSLHWRNFKSAHNSERIVALMTNEAYARLYGLNESLLSTIGDPAQMSDGFTGMPWAARFLGVPLTDPWALLTVLAGGAAPPATMLLGAMVPILIAAAFGKVYCSFLCPARLLFELTNAVRRGLMWIGLPLLALPMPRIGLWIGLGALLASLSAGPAVFQLVLPYYGLEVGLAVWLTTGAFTAIVGWTFTLVVFELFLAPGQVCHALCPTGALLEWFGRTPLLALVRRGSPCPPSCDLCQRACPYGLFPGREVHRPACDTCGTCVSACPSRKLSPRMIRPRWLSLFFAMGFGLVVAGTASAHHNKGLPHYGYFENYPQVPTEEFIDEIGRWEVGAVFFNFQGMRRETSDTPDDVRIFAYLFDLEAQRGYRGPLDLRVETEDGQLVERFTRTEADQEGVYVVRLTLPSSGTYRLVYEVPVDGDKQDVPLRFEVNLEADRIPWMPIALGGGALVLVFSVAAAGRKNRIARHAVPVEVTRGP